MNCINCTEIGAESAMNGNRYLCDNCKTDTKKEMTPEQKERLEAIQADIRKELEATMKNQQQLIELGDFELAHEIEADITYLKSKLGDFTSEFSHLL